MHPYITKRMLDQTPPHKSEPKRNGLFRKWMVLAKQQWQRRKMIAALEAMDDRLLRDIGIYRGDIKRVVDGFDDRELRMVPLAASTTVSRLDLDTYQKAA